MSESRLRREPPGFRVVEVRAVEPRTTRLVRVTLGGDALVGFDPGLPAASVRLLLPDPAAGLVLPTWNGNEFLHTDGRRPLLRTLTPLRHDPVARALDLEIVRHGPAPLADWVAAAKPGDRVALSGPGRGYEVDPDAPAFLLAGDESALPAITTLVPVLPPAAAVHVAVEVADRSARLELPTHPRLDVEWCPSMVDAVAAHVLVPGERVWVAGNAAVVQRIRKHLFEERGVPRSHAVVRGYWK